MFAEHWSEERNNNHEIDRDLMPTQLQTICHEMKTKHLHMN